MIIQGDFGDWLTARCNVVGESDGHEMLITCPWCSRDKLYANPTTKVFVCFRCRESGRADYLVAKVEGVTLSVARERMRDRTLPEEDALLREIGGLSRGEVDTTPPVYHPLPEEFISCFTGKGWRVPPYLDERGVTDSMIIRHGLGWAKYGRYRDRVILPVFQGEHRTFLSRLMGKPRRFRWRDHDTQEWVVPPKYMTPRDAGLSRTLYGSTWAKSNADLIIVEGSFDVMRLVDLGFDVGGVLGKRLSREQARLVRILNPKTVTFMYDAGAYTEACEDADTLAHCVDAETCPLYVARVPEGLDPDSLGLEEGRSGVRDVMAHREPAGSGWASLDAGIASL